MVRDSRATFAFAFAFLFLAFLSLAFDALAVIGALHPRVSCVAALVARVDSLRGRSAGMRSCRPTRVDVFAIAEVEAATDLEVA